MTKEDTKTIVIDTPITPYLVGGIMIYNLYNMYNKKKEKTKNNSKKGKKVKNNSLDFNIKK